MSQFHQTGYMHQAITQAVLNFLPESIHHRVDSWMQPNSIRPQVKNTGTGFELGLMTYTSSIHIENVPFKNIDTASLLAQVTAWVIEHDSERDRLSEDEKLILIDSDKVDEDTIDIDIDVMFCELMSVVSDNTGSIVFDGQPFALNTPQYQVAESITISVGTDHD